jgi:hypothetical protein
MGADLGRHAQIFALCRGRQAEEIASNSHFGEFL